VCSVFIYFLSQAACAAGRVVHAWPTPAFGSLLYDNWIWDIPQLFDVCVLYGESNPGWIQRFLLSIVMAQPSYYDDLASAWSLLAKVPLTFLSSFSVWPLPPSACRGRQKKNQNYFALMHFFLFARNVLKA
jgi:hypothetical protein